MKRLVGEQRGLALILVLWLVAVMTLIVATVVIRSRDAVDLVFFSEGIGRSYFLARSGMLSAMKKSPGIKEFRDRAAGEFYRVTIEEESGLLNINGLDEAQLRSVFAKFTDDKERLDIAVNAILDWRDSDNIKRPNGAESLYYRRRSPSYFATNGPLNMVEELVLIKGVADIVSLEQVRKTFTVYGDGKVNLQSAPQAVIELLPGVSESQARRLVSLREALLPKPLAEGDLKVVFGEYLVEKLGKWVTLSDSAVLRVTSEGWLEGSTTRVQLVWWLRSGESKPVRSLYKLVYEPSS